MSEVIMSGVVVAVLPAESGVSQKSGQQWMKQSYVLQHEQGQYPRHICFEIFGQDKIQQAAIRQGEQITVHLNFDSKAGSKDPSKWFNEVRCWKVERMGQQMYAQQGQMQGGWPQQQGWQQPAPQQFPQQGYQQPMQQMPPQQQAQAQFPPQVNAQGQPMYQQQAAPAAQPPQQNGGLPFPPPAQ